MQLFYIKIFECLESLMHCYLHFSDIMNSLITLNRFILKYKGDVLTIEQPNIKL